MQSSMENEKTKKVIMIHLPPAQKFSPSPAFSVLKKFLSQQGYGSQIINWNISTQDLVVSSLPFFSGSIEEFYVLLAIPFLMEIAERHNDLTVKRRILAYFHNQFPKYTMSVIGDGSEIIEQIRNKILKFIDSELEKLNIDGVILFGLSAKLFQWIPGVVMAEKLKNRFPGIKIVIGGFGSQKDAGALMSICPYFDFAIWGEGEYPLLELLHRLENGEGINCLESVPHLVYREIQGLKITTARSRYVDFNKYKYPDFTDYFSAMGDNADMSAIRLPLETSRGCHWKRCKFCYLNVGYKYRRRSPGDIVGEIEHMSSRYNVNRFLVVDNDTTGADKERFERLLDMIIESSMKRQVIYEFQAEINHHGLNSRIIEKMALAGFTGTQIGYEAITDELLKKMDKKTDFSDIILFVKFAIKFGITTIGANIMRGIVGETAGDVMKSIENLPFLRFFLNSKTGRTNIRHILIKLRLEPGSRFLHMVDDEEKKEWNFHPIAHLLPESFINSDKQLHFFGFTRNLENEIEWSQFEKINNFYQETEFKYRLNEHKGLHYYSEFMNEELINYIIFNEPEYWEVLRAANDEVTSFDEIYVELTEKFPGLTEDRLTGIIGALKADYLLYANKDLSRIVSIIDAR